MKKIILSLLGFVMAASITSCTTQNETSYQSKSNAEVVMENILNRKSVRHFVADSISDDVMENLLRAAMSAPTGMNVQPWHIIVLKDTSRYDEIFGNNFNMRMYKESSAVVIFCADTTVTRPPRDNPDAPAVTTPNSIWRDDMGACTENFLLAVEAHGLGACWTACYPYPERMNPIREALNIPDNFVPYSVVPVGTPAGDEKPKDKWKPEKVHYENW